MEEKMEKVIYIYKQGFSITLMEEGMKGNGNMTKKMEMVIKE